jgi:hypothetical protein
MIGRKATVGLALLCALLFSAFAAQIASAVKGTTAFTCDSGAATKDFADEHCDRHVGPPEGAFGHTEIKEGTKTEVETTNGKTKNETKESAPVVLKGTAGGAATEIVCTTVKGTGILTNVGGGVMQVEGEKLEAKYSSCTVQKPAKCVVKEPIELKNLTAISRISLGASKNEMGGEYKPEAGKPFTEISYEGAECGLKGTKLAIEGTAIATGSAGSTETTTYSGGTSLFTNSMTKETLTFGGKAAEFSSTGTAVMKEAGGKPITLTTL